MKLREIGQELFNQSKLRIKFNDDVGMQYAEPVTKEQDIEYRGL